MDLREGKKKGCSNRPRRSVVENNERNKVERRKRKRCCPHRIQFRAVRHRIRHVPGSPSAWVGRKSKYRVCNAMSWLRNSEATAQEVRSIYFRLENQADRATDVFVFNYKKRDQFVDVAAFERFTDQCGSLVGVCAKTKSIRASSTLKTFNWSSTATLQSKEERGIYRQKGHRE